MAHTSVPKTQPSPRDLAALEDEFTELAAHKEQRNAAQDVSAETFLR